MGGGGVGDFCSGGASINYAQRMMFPLPQGIGGPPRALTQGIVFRVWMQPQTLIQPSEVGGFESAPVIGEAAAVAAVHHVLFDELVRAYLWLPIDAMVFGLLGLLALSLACFARFSRVYLSIEGLLLMLS